MEQLNVKWDLAEGFAMAIWAVGRLDEAVSKLGAIPKILGYDAKGLRGALANAGEELEALLLSEAGNAEAQLESPGFFESVETAINAQRKRISPRMEEETENPESGDPETDEDEVEIGEVSPGTAVLAGGIELEVLDTHFKSGYDTEVVFCLAKDIVFKEAFDDGNSNDWRKSSLRKFLNGDYLNGLDGDFAESLAPFQRDLTADDGSKDYCDASCVDVVSLISCDEYRTYREHISNKPNWWWTLTAYSTPRSGCSLYVRRVGTDGRLNGDDAYRGNGGVAPAFSLLPSSKVKVLEENRAKEERNP